MIKEKMEMLCNGERRKVCDGHCATCCPDLTKLKSDTGKGCHLCNRYQNALKRGELK